MNQERVKESKEFWRPPNNPPVEWNKGPEEVEKKMEEYVLQNAKENDAGDVINKIDEFCVKNWMMNLGDEKAKIVVSALKKEQKINKVLEIGGYCGYSSIVFAHACPNAHVYTLEINKYFSQIAQRVQKHAGVSERTHIHLAKVKESEEFLKQHGPFDMIFIDHVKGEYLADFLLLEQYGVIAKGSLVIGDNIIKPGAPDYLAHFNSSFIYESTLYHSYVEYCDDPDAVLVSKKL